MEFAVGLKIDGKADHTVVDADDALEMVATLAPEHIYRELRAKLEANDYLNRQQWPMIG
jgi:hypothetical protein